MVTMNDELEYIRRFITFLQEHDWHNELRPNITTFLDSKHIETDVDNLLMGITKKVETVLRDSIQQHQGSTERTREVGIRLLNSAVHCHLIKNKEELLYALLYWILKEPRNIHHHDFKLHPLKNLILFMLQSDYAIGALKNLLASSFEGRFNLDINEDEKSIKISNVKVFCPDKTELPEDAKLEAFLTFSNGKGANVELKPNGDGRRSGKYDYRGASAGTVNVRLGGVVSTTTFTTASSSMVFLWPRYKNCPKCGATVSENDSRCPKCGHRFYIY